MEKDPRRSYDNPFYEPEVDRKAVNTVIETLLRNEVDPKSVKSLLRIPQTVSRDEIYNFVFYVDLRHYEEKRETLTGAEYIPDSYGVYSEEISDILDEGPHNSLGWFTEGFIPNGNIYLNGNIKNFASQVYEEVYPLTENELIGIVKDTEPRKQISLTDPEYIDFSVV